MCAKGHLCLRCKVAARPCPSVSQLSQGFLAIDIDVKLMWTGRVTCSNLCDLPTVLISRCQGGAIHTRTIHSRVSAMKGSGWAIQAG